jgi:hypothetical protein
VDEGIGEHFVEREFAQFHQGFDPAFRDGRQDPSAGDNAARLGSLPVRSKQSCHLGPAAYSVGYVTAIRVRTALDRFPLPRV